MFQKSSPILAVVAAFLLIFILPALAQNSNDNGIESPKPKLVPPKPQRLMAGMNTPVWGGLSAAAGVAVTAGACCCHVPKKNDRDLERAEYDISEMEDAQNKTSDIELADTTTVKKPANETSLEANFGGHAESPVSAVSDGFNDGIRHCRPSTPPPSYSELSSSDVKRAGGSTVV